MLKITMHYFIKLYIFFIILALNIFFFSTTKLEAKAFKIDNIEISKPFENNFNKNEIINIGFKDAFLELMKTILNSSDYQKINEIKLNEIKGMIESFSIQEEKFIDQNYYVNLGVSFNKKKIFYYLENKNIFPSIPVKESFLFIPILIDENINELVIFSKNPIFDNWNLINKKHLLLEYVLPTEDLEDLDLIKSKYDLLENYDFKDVTRKYFLNNSIIALVFKNEKGLRVLSKINIQDETFIKNKLYIDLDLKDENHLIRFIDDQKKIYEDTWKNFNQINTSIKLQLNVRIGTNDQLRLSQFDEILSEMDLVYDFFIKKFNKDFIFYEIIFNGTPKNFIDTMSANKYEFDIQKKIWIVK